MKTEIHILIAFFANVILALVELIGGLIVGSFSIISDSLHSLGDSATIGISFFLEIKSKKKADKRHSFGYARYSMLGGLLTNMFLLVGSFTVIMHAIKHLFEPHGVASGGMLIIALLGAFANLIAALATRRGRSHNEKAVSLHAVQDVLTHLAIIFSAIIIHYTGFFQIDAILSILIAVFIFLHVSKHLRESLDIFLDNTPAEIDVDKIEAEILKLKGVKGLHHMHIWSLDGKQNCATLHVLANEDSHELKCAIRKIFAKNKVKHVTIEIGLENCCDDEVCEICAVKA